MQYFFVNQRMVRDKLINHAVRQALETIRNRIDAFGVAERTRALIEESEPLERLFEAVHREAQSLVPGEVIDEEVSDHEILEPVEELPLPLLQGKASP